jgi:hypothetical protein
MLSSTGYFTCPSGDVPDTAPLQTMLLDLLGRRPYGESASQPAQPLMRQLNAHISGQYVRIRAKAEAGYLAFRFGDLLVLC